MGVCKIYLGPAPVKAWRNGFCNRSRSTRQGGTLENSNNCL
jgi:hypothetical protein